MNREQMEDVISAIGTEHIDRFFQEIEEVQKRKKARRRVIFSVVAPIVVFAVFGTAVGVVLHLSNKVKAKPIVYYLENNKEITLTIASGRYRFSGEGPMWDVICNNYVLEGVWEPTLVEENVYSSDATGFSDEEGFAFMYLDNGVSIAKTPARNLWLNFVEIESDS